MRRWRNPRRGEGGRNWSRLSGRLRPGDPGQWMRVGLGGVTWAAVSLILLGYDLFPGRISLRLGERSPSLIRAPRTAQYVDPDETDRLRREAAQRAAMSPQYASLPFALADAEKWVDGVFDAVGSAGSDPASWARLTQTLPSVPAEAWDWARGASLEQVEALRQKAGGILRRVMSEEIRQGTADLGAAQEQAATRARQEKAPGARALLRAVVVRGVAPNRRYDQEATEEAKAEAEARVQGVVRTIPADHAITLPGERVTRRHLAMLDALGLRSPGLHWRRLAAVGLIVGLMVVVLGAQTRRWARRVYDRPKLLLLLSLLMAVALFVTNLLAFSLPNAWMLMVPTATLMAAVLLAEEVGLALAVCLSFLVGLMPNAGLMAALLCLGSAVVALSYVSHLWPPARLRWIVGMMAGTNLVLVSAAGLLVGQSLLSVLREAGLAAVLYGPGAAALGLGGIFLLQRPFGITTHLGLLELSNPQHPVLRRLQSEAPGTYYASVLVGDLADAAAQAVGADALLARVGALYHDIGKLQRPAFFVENQGLLGLENVHDRLSSSLSGLIIMAHVKDGSELARQHRLPPELIEIIEQHHGSTLVSFFYQRALAGEHPESVTEDHFRYPGPLPRSKEAALVMLADSVQAAAKAISEPTPQRVQQMVRDILRDRVVGGQLGECDLTFRDLGAVEATMARTLTALVCHTRIEYPEPAPAAPGAL